MQVAGLSMAMGAFIAGVMPQCWYDSCATNDVVPHDCAPMR